MYGENARRDMRCDHNDLWRAFGGVTVQCACVIYYGRRSAEMIERSKANVSAEHRALFLEAAAIFKEKAQRVAACNLF